MNTNNTPTMRPVMLHTTLARLREWHACGQHHEGGSYRKLVASLPADHADDAPIPLDHILRSNGIEDALWALRACGETHKEWISREHARRSAERVLPIFERALPGDRRPREAIEVARRFLRGEASYMELSAAAYAAGEAGFDAAKSGAGEAAQSAAFAAEAASGGHPAWAAAREAALAAEPDAEREAQALDLLQLLGVQNGR